MASVPRWIAAPVLRAWVASKSGEVDRLPRPSDAPESHAIGIHSDQVLILGGGPAVGWGVLSHELALTGALARALSRRTDRGADVYAVPVPKLKVCAAPDLLSRTKLCRFDAVVVTLGVNDAGALTPLPDWERDLTRTLQMIAQRSSIGSRIFLAGVHPIRSIPVYDSPLGSIADAHARRMNEVSASVCERLPRVTYVPLSAPARSDPPRFRDAMSYRHWAEELTDSMAPQLDSARQMADFNRAIRSSDDPDSPRERAAAMRELGILVADNGSRFDALIALACTTFGVRSATVSVIDADRLVHKAERGNVPARVMLEASFSACVIREPEGMIIPDATLDPRFRDLPHVFGPPRVRFYAGFPLESPDGSRIGTLNLFDPAPRFTEESWRQLRLKQFGLMVQAELCGHRRLH